MLANGQVWLGLGITAFGFAGVFALYTYVEPLLTQVTRMGDSLVALTLLLFGAGLAAGNLLGGKLADRGVMRALVWSIAALMVVLAAGRWAFGNQAVAMAYVIVLGVVAFATVAPMQMRVLDQAGPQGANLVSSLNIAAFNLGNALGAWVGGLALAGGLGLVNLGWAYATMDQGDKGIGFIQQGIAKGGLKDAEEAKLRLGEAYAAAGRKQQAINTLKTVGGKDGSADLARYWIMAINRPVA
ncbi:MAG: Inner membrane transport protein YdhP [Delftia tsuruhatensis]|nr:MAG: Inner membrane transport protein YdhP [Delftia tsuruhatensis]